MRAAAHEDINIITLLPAATRARIRGKRCEGQLACGFCDTGNIVVNVADMLQLATEYYYKSTTHRVMNPTMARDTNLVFQCRYFYMHARKYICRQHALLKSIWLSGCTKLEFTSR